MCATPTPGDETTLHRFTRSTAIVCSHSTAWRFRLGRLSSLLRAWGEVRTSHTGVVTCHLPSPTRVFVVFVIHTVVSARSAVVILTSVVCMFGCHLSRVCHGRVWLSSVVAVAGLRLSASSVSHRGYDWPFVVSKLFESSTE